MQGGKLPAASIFLQWAAAKAAQSTDESSTIMKAVVDRLETCDEWNVSYLYSWAAEAEGPVEVLESRELRKSAQARDYPSLFPWPESAKYAFLQGRLDTNNRLDPTVDRQPRAACTYRDVPYSVLAVAANRAGKQRLAVSLSSLDGSLPRRIQFLLDTSLGVGAPNRLRGCIFSVSLASTDVIFALR